ncbi:metallophosphoesterase family protein [Paenibacillus sp. CAU 1782]
MKPINSNEYAEKPILSFQVITDTHVRAESDHAYNRHFELALLDIAANGGGSCGIMHVGDLTDHGFPSEYAEMSATWRKFEDQLPPLYATMGNHDVGLGIWEDRIQRFLRHSGMSGPYHDHWIEGYHFIFLGTEKNLELYCSLSGKQLQWLDQTLNEQKSPDRPVFVFLHQPLINTVAGSLERQEWHGVVEDEELRTVLAKHPNAILFTGHTHWELESEHTHFEGGNSLPDMFNAASAAYLWSDEGEAIAGSQGFYVEVYSNRVCVRGRDFLRGEWVEKAQFEVKY